MAICQIRLICIEKLLLWTRWNELSILTIHEGGLVWLDQQHLVVPSRRQLFSIDLRRFTVVYFGVTASYTSMTLIYSIFISVIITDAV